MTLINTLQQLSVGTDKKQELESLFHEGKFLLLGQNLSIQGFHDIAGDVYQKAFAFQEAFEAYQKCCAWKKMCLTAISSDDAHLKEECIRQLLKAQKAEQALSWIPQAATLFKATLLVQMNRHHDAAPIFEAAGHWMSAAQAYEKTNNYSQAGMLYERLMKSNIEDPQIHVRYARILMELGQFHDAIKNLQPCLNNAPDSVQNQIFPLLLVSFLALNLRESAHTLLARWGEIDASKEIPQHIDIFLRSPLATYYLDRQKTRNDDDAPIVLGGRYLLIQPLDTTPTSERWLGFDRLSSITVHIDILDEKWIASDGFEQVVQELQAITKENRIGSVHYLDIKPYQNYFVKKPALAPPLKQVFTTVSWAEMRRQFYRLLDIIENFHNAGWYHTQLNLSNIFWGPRHLEIDGWAFRHIQGLLQTLTSGDDSPWRFCAPEVFHNEAPDQRADIYSLTALLQYYFQHQAKTLALSIEESHQWKLFWDKNLSNDVSLRAPNIAALRQQIPSWPANCDSKAPQTPALIPQKVILPHHSRIKLLYQNSEYELFESYHAHLHRIEWVVRFRAFEYFARLHPWANMQNGVQPVYRWLSEYKSIVIAPGAERLITVEALKQFPYSLMRDLSAVAAALNTLHQTGLGLDGFEKERCLGAYGPQLQLAPGKLPTQLTKEAKTNDEISFIALVAACFSLENTGELWQALRQHFLQQNKISAAAIDEHDTTPNSLSSWSVALMTLSSQLKEDDAQHLFTQVTSEIYIGRRGE
jgi:tetratricopeptide (TPR) repeat protein